MENYASVLKNLQESTLLTTTTMSKWIHRPEKREPRLTSVVISRHLGENLLFLLQNFLE